MKAVIQRVERASVKINDKEISRISQGLLILLGVSKEDTEEDVILLADKIRNLRIFSDKNGKMNLNIRDIQGEFLIVSQFTLLANCRNGNRPDFAEAADKIKAYDLYKRFVNYLKDQGEKVKEGEFQAYMSVELVNDGPVTIILDSKDLKKPRRSKE